MGSCFPTTDLRLPTQNKVELHTYAALLDPPGPCVGKGGRCQQIYEIKGDGSYDVRLLEECERTRNRGGSMGID